MENSNSNILEVSNVANKSKVTFGELEILNKFKVRFCDAIGWRCLWFLKGRSNVKSFIFHCCGIFWRYLKIKTIVYCCLSEKNVGHQSLTPKRHAWYMQGSNTMRNLPNSMPKLYSWGLIVPTNPVTYLTKGSKTNKKDSSKTFT